MHHMFNACYKRLENKQEIKKEEEKAMLAFKK